MKATLKEVLAKVLGDHIYNKTVVQTVTVGAGKNGVRIPLGLPTGATVISASISKQPNANWIHAGANGLTDTYFDVAWDNTYSGVIVGDFYIEVLYRL